MWGYSEGCDAASAVSRDEAADKAREPQWEKAPEQDRTAELDKSRELRGFEMEM